MALTFYGFLAGEDIDTLKWSYLADGVGGDYRYLAASSFRVNAGTLAREVIVAPGRTTGWGVHAYLEAPYSLTIADPGSATRCWLVVLERNWTTPASSTIRAVDTGGPTRVWPSSLSSRRSGAMIDQQPLAWVTVKTGSTTEVADARALAGNVLSVTSAASALNPQPGQLYVTADGTLLRTVWDPVTQSSSLSPAGKRSLAFDVENVQAKNLGQMGELRVSWPGGPLGWRPKWVSALVHAAPQYGTLPVVAIPNLLRPPTVDEGHLVLRTTDGAPYRGNPSQPNSNAVQRLTVTITEE